MNDLNFFWVTLYSLLFGVIALILYALERQCMVSEKNI